MAILKYSAIMSLDGYVADEEGTFDWAVPDDEVHSFINERVRAVGMYLYGRRMYETMAGWETAHTAPDQPPVGLDFAEIWRDADKIVFSRTLDEAWTAKTEIKREFDAEFIRQKKGHAHRDLIIGGPEIASCAFAAGLIDECELYVAPVVVGGGKRALPENIRLPLQLLDERRFGNGMIYVGYRVR